VRRREFIILVGGAAAWPLATHAQPAKLPTIGFLGTATPSTWSQFVAAFVQRLRDLGWVEGRNVAIEFRWAEGRTERYSEIATEFVRLKVDVIVTSGGAVLATKQATSIIPIVFAIATDPVASGMVASLARPGGNITGLSIQSTDLASKRLELLREIIPDLRRLAIVGNASNPNALMEMAEVQATARSLGFVEVITPKIRRVEDIAPAFEALKGHAEALYLTPDPLIISHQIQISNLALRARLAVMSLAIRRSGSSDVIWTKQFRLVPKGGRICRQDSPRNKAGRSSSPAADELPASDQSQDREGARPHGSSADSDDSQRADRMMAECPLLALSGPLARTNVGFGGKADNTVDAENVRL